MASLRARKAVIAKAARIVAKGGPFLRPDNPSFCAIHPRYRMPCRVCAADLAECHGLRTIEEAQAAGTPIKRSPIGRAALVPVNIARCPEHGLHGERQECFICGGPVEQVPMVPVKDVLATRLLDEL